MFLGCSPDEVVEAEAKLLIGCVEDVEAEFLEDRVAPLVPDDESAEDVDIAELRYVGGKEGGATCLPTLMTPTGTSSSSLSSDGVYPGGGKSSGDVGFLCIAVAPEADEGGFKLYCDRM